MRTAARLALLAALAVLLLALLGWHLHGGWRHRPELASRAVPWSAEESGQLAAVKFLAATGLDPRPWRHPWTHLRGPGALVVLLPDGSARAPDAFEARAALDWVARGQDHALVIFCESTNPLLARLGGEVVPGTATNPEWRASSTRLPLLAGAQRLRCLSVARRLQFASGRDHQALYTCHEDLRAAYLSHGRGHVLVFTDVFPATNVGLLPADNAVLLRNLARDFLAEPAARPQLPGGVEPPEWTVWVDEQHHGRSEPVHLLARLAHWGVPPGALLHAGLVALLLVWALRSRLGRPVEALEELSRDGTEQARALADLHWGLAHDPVVREDLRRRLAAAVARIAPAAVRPGGTVLWDKVPADRLPPALLARLKEAIGLSSPWRILRAAREVERLEALAREGGRRG